jgi:hypothetical protein
MTQSQVGTPERRGAGWFVPSGQVGYFVDPREGSCDRTLFELAERRKDQYWQLSAHCPRVFGHHEHLAALV